MAAPAKFTIQPKKKNHVVYTPAKQFESPQFTVHSTSGLMSNNGKSTVKQQHGVNQNNHNGNTQYGHHHNHSTKGDPSHRSNPSNKSTSSYVSNKSNRSNSSRTSSDSNSSIKYKIVPKQRDYHKPLPPANNKPTHINRNSLTNKRRSYGSKLHESMQRNSNEKISTPFNSHMYNNGNNSVNQQQPQMQSNEPKAREVASLFSKQYESLLKEDFEVPASSTKDDLQEIRSKVNSLYDTDVVALESFYDDQLRILDEMLAEM
mmetsp:Transcript_1616/g.2612  ORF Transcript_1616/g.2612 Transcript_1616/m.2612 type:complete len:261 (-) Transcript_1616:2795-3577(-)|eukprot:CAMPEP_0197072106 /NCGR_PEP_ID=MMETSP1384-20130603/209928_1 /TAXON_ID=29189 /ORGANISM="Ammonia sp." /LENGTH=260 /DNA_ID=CAMNT_0042510921 /DNA_START=985 /DNA_END=1767 /DNA_ORIENTATION=+